MSQHHGDNLDVRPVGLRERIRSGGVPLLLPGASNALTARVIEQLGFEAVYVSGAGVANSYLGSPDVGLVTMTELVSHVAAVRDAVDIPIVVDADTGFGNAINVRRTVQALARAGANGIQLEDQFAPKRCGHFDGKSVITAAEMVGKIHSALDARSDDSVIIIARTDAQAVFGLEDACDRAQQYLDAGADVAFVEAPTNLAEMQAIGRRVQGPLLANIVEGGKTPQVSLTQLGEMGFDIALYANAALRAAVTGMRRVLSHLQAQGDTLGVLDQLITWEDRQGLVRKPMFDGLEDQYSR